MIKQVLITSITAAGLLLSAQATAHNSGGSVTVWKNASNSHNHGHKHHVKKVRRAPPKYNVNREQRQQATMIAQGIKTCQITPREATKLNKRQAKINKTERRLRKHGLSYAESMKLKTSLHSARVQINRLTKNGKKCGRRAHKRSFKHGHKRVTKPTYNHSHGHKQHRHTSGNNFHSHSNWGFTNNKGSFSISIGH